MIIWEPNAYRSKYFIMAENLNLEDHEGLLYYAYLCSDVKI